MKPMNIIAGCMIEPNCRSQIFSLDLSRLLTILNPIVASVQMNEPCAKIFARNGHLIASISNNIHLNNNHNHNIESITNVQEDQLNRSDWLYHVRLASNCFEQNLVAYPATLAFEGTRRGENGDTFWPVFYMVVKPIEPGQELSFWPWFGLSIQLGIPPFLSPINILNNHCYICHQCGRCFAQPNPLKIHLVLACSKRTSFIPSIEFDKSHVMETNTTSHPQDQINQNSQLCPIGCSNKNNKPGTRHHQSQSMNRRNQKLEVRSDRLESLPRRLHTCSYCGKVYTRKYGLKIHIRTHTGVKPLSCRYCGRSFSDPSNLNKHMRLHTQHLQTTTTMAARRNPLKHSNRTSLHQHFSVKSSKISFRHDQSNTDAAISHHSA